MWYKDKIHPQSAAAPDPVLVQCQHGVTQCRDVSAGGVGAAAAVIVVVLGLWQDYFCENRKPFILSVLPLVKAH